MWMLVPGRAGTSVGARTGTRLANTERPGNVQDSTNLEPAGSSPGDKGDPVGTSPREITEALITPVGEPDEVAPATPEPTAIRDAARAVQVDAGLLVHSTPAGAIVTVDGVPRGITPVAIRGLALGNRTVVVSRAGYQDVERQVVLTGARPSRTLEIELLPVARAASQTLPPPTRDGSVVIDSRPAGAVVFIDGQRAGVTPLTITLGAGDHTVRMEHAGYRSVTTRIDVKAGERARVAVRLEGGQEQE
jgi:hypothetical protein